ncbi:SDR family NAD(P)-dependent oxidoreductase [Vibrio sp. 10N.261.55.A7]|uniref:SDR family NAD(P)-dependent oxidoreductase n=1 Tax=Vibrio sp. 10N.261.55.A7 TaxID=1880851 RepID=UPI000C82E923|nr:SDR family NAD(P)-dependent oxidoreductase [Vibrio sp. 10N.261.55.A7]PMJ88283.1 oxidoreductase [Vibrio sp. 10N.261.55.A7]
MKKTILVTGATDGIGLETVKSLVDLNHRVIVHGRSASKVAAVVEQLSVLNASTEVDSIVADLSDFSAIKAMVEDLQKRFRDLDVLINNAGVYKVPTAQLESGLDVRFMVNTIAPYLLSKALLPTLKGSARIVNLSSAAQASVNSSALEGQRSLGDSDAYAQSKLALTMWSRSLGLEYKDKGPVVVSVNPKSLLGSKMVKDAYGISGGDLSLGADILVRAALSDEFSNAFGQYYDNDIESFAQPHPDALNDQKVNQVIDAIDRLITQHT